MIPYQMSIIANLVDFNRTVDLFMYLPAMDSNNGQEQVVKPIVLDMQNINSYEEIPQPALSMTKRHAQMILDELHRLGMRPSNAQSREGVEEALKDNLLDLRMLVKYYTFGARVADLKVYPPEGKD